jgi:hypothetical protein
LADAGLFVGFGQPARAREQQALELFDRALALYTELQARAEIESFEPVLLEPHGGDLYGFILIRGTADQLHELRRSDDFRRISARAGLVVEQFGVVDAHVGEGVAAQITIYDEQMREQLDAG